MALHAAYLLAGRQLPQADRAVVTAGQHARVPSDDRAMLTTTSRWPSSAASVRRGGAGCPTADFGAEAHLQIFAASGLVQQRQGGFADRIQPLARLLAFRVIAAAELLDQSGERGAVQRFATLVGRAARLAITTTASTSPAPETGAARCHADSRLSRFTSASRSSRVRLLSFPDWPNNARSALLLSCVRWRSGVIVKRGGAPPGSRSRVNATTQEAAPAAAHRGGDFSPSHTDRLAAPEIGESHV